jgi:hypothetical protein
MRRFKIYFEEKDFIMVGIGVLLCHGIDRRMVEGPVLFVVARSGYQGFAGGYCVLCIVYIFPSRSGRLVMWYCSTIGIRVLV